MQVCGSLHKNEFTLQRRKPVLFMPNMPSVAFYGELCEFMASEPVVVQVLHGEGAILKNREVMGATNPANADTGTIRKDFALSVGENSVHGSDSEKSAAREICFFFSGLELVG